MKKLAFIVSVLILVALLGCTQKTPATETYYETQYRTEYRTETYTVVENVVVGTVDGVDVLNTKAQWKSVRDYWTDYYGYEISPQKHTRSQVWISLASIDNGIIRVVNLTDACSDKNVLHANLIFGKESTVNTNVFLPTEGCQVVNPMLMALELSGGSSEVFKQGIDSLISATGRNLGEGRDDITFDAKGIKEFAVFISIKSAFDTSIISTSLIWSDDVIESRTVSKERQVPYQVSVQVEKQR